ncbi:MAG: hypothetical protein IPM53_12295 [Anaerolineaceae bacterium]|nr:hypothetical protein [Anaerolineaceae bacterium]
MNIYEFEAYVQDYQKMRLQEAETRRLLRQAEPCRSFRWKFRLPKLMVKWALPAKVAKPMQECPEVA